VYSIEKRIAGWWKTIGKPQEKHWNYGILLGGLWNMNGL